MPPDSPDQPDAATLLRVMGIVRRLAVPCDLDELLELIIDTGREVLHADRGSVLLYDGASRELYARVATGAPEIRFSIDRGIAGECARTREVINVPDCYADPRFNPDFDRQSGYRTRALISVPLIGLDDQLVGVMQLLNPEKGRFTAVDARIAVALASHAAVGLQRSLLIQERLVKMKLESDLELARDIQQAVLPETLPQRSGYDIAAFSRPAEQTGGDIYDLIDPPSEQPVESSPLMMLLADATGHGIGPALSVTQIRAMLRVAIRFTDDLDQLLERINDQATADLGARRFVTAFFGLLDPTEHRVWYRSAGQGPLLHYRAADGECTSLSASTIPLGLVTSPPGDQPDPIDLAPGDWLVLLTDGFYEYANEAGDMFREHRVTRVIADHLNDSAATCLDALLETLTTFAAGAEQKDDLTAILLRRLP